MRRRVRVGPGRGDTPSAGVGRVLHALRMATLSRDHNVEVESLMETIPRTLTKEPPMNPKGLQVSTPTDTTIVLTRTFNAPRRLVWEAFTTPDTMRRWMLPPPGWTLTVCECEARVAGALRLVWKSAEADPALSLLGVFTEAVAHERMIHTEVMVLGGGAGQPIGSQVETHEFAEHNGVTTMRITQVYASKEVRDCAIESGACPGMEAGFEQLDALLAQSA